MKTIRLIIILLLLQAAFFRTAYCRTETIIGTVMAYQPLAQLVCVWHPCAVFLIVKVEDKKETKYLRMDVEYFPAENLPNRGYPLELTEKSKRWKFTVIRDEKRDATLEKYETVFDENGKQIANEPAFAVWQLLSGAENARLPFGEILPNYRVPSNKFKRLK